MYRISISKQVEIEIEEFIDSFLDSSLRMFIDTGIDNISLIRKGYLDSANLFKNHIFSSVKDIFESSFVPKRVSENGGLSVIVAVGNFRLFIDYTEDTKRKLDISNI